MADIYLTSEELRKLPKINVLQHAQSEIYSDEDLIYKVLNATIINETKLMYLISMTPYLKYCIKTLGRLFVDLNLRGYVMPNMKDAKQVDEIITDSSFDNKLLAEQLLEVIALMHSIEFYHTDLRMWNLMIQNNQLFIGDMLSFLFGSEKTSEWESDVYRNELFTLLFILHKFNPTPPRLDFEFYDYCKECLDVLDFIGDEKLNNYFANPDGNIQKLNLLKREYDIVGFKEYMKKKYQKN